MAVIERQQIVRDRLTYKFAVTEEKAFPDRQRQQPPARLFTASATVSAPAVT